MFTDRNNSILRVRSEPRQHTVKLYASAREVQLLSRSNLDLLLVTLKTFSAMSTHVINICGKIH